MKTFREPKFIIAEALNCDINSLSPDVGFNAHPAWDSLGQLLVINSIEKAYNIKISNDNIMKLSTLEAITNLYNSLNYNE